MSPGLAELLRYVRAGESVGTGTSPRWKPERRPRRGPNGPAQLRADALAAGLAPSDLNGHSLSKVVMGLGWDPAQRGRNIDLDASVISYDGSGRKLEIVWFIHKREYGGAIVHSGDNLTGQGEGADEQIRVGALPADVRHLVFTINSFTGQRFHRGPQRLLPSARGFNQRRARPIRPVR